LAFGLVDALAIESDPRVRRMLDLMRERGWASWTRTRPERLAGAAGPASGVASPPDISGTGGPLTGHASGPSRTPDLFASGAV
jgi:hypothetical protein